LASSSATDIFGSRDVIAGAASNAEQLGIARLDRVALFFHGDRIVLHGLDILERLAAGLLLGLWMHRAQAADIDDELLCLSAEAERLEQFCRVRIWRGLEYPVRADDERRALNGIDGLQRASFFLDLENVVLVAISHDGAFAKLK